MSELLTEETRLAIQHLIIKCANDAKKQADNFAKNETSIGKQHPKGLNAHLIEVIFEQKKEIKRGSTLGSRWVNSNCPEVFSKDVISHIIELATDHFIKEKEDDTYYLQKEWIKELRTDQKILDSLAEHYLLPFFIGIRKVYALEGIVKDKIEYPEPAQTERPALASGLTLWDLFVDKTKVDIIKQKLKASGRLIIDEDGKTHFKPTRKNSKYEAESLRQALIFNQLLDTKIELVHTEITKMLQNTFHGFVCDVRTLNAAKMPDKVEYYRLLCKPS